MKPLTLRQLFFYNGLTGMGGCAWMQPDVVIVWPDISSRGDS